MNKSLKFSIATLAFFIFSSWNLSAEVTSSEKYRLINQIGNYWNFNLTKNNLVYAETKNPYRVKHKANLEGGSHPILVTKSNIVAFSTTDNSIVINIDGILKETTGYQHRYKIRSLAISNDGKYLISGSGKVDERFGKDLENPSYSIAIWDIAERKYLGGIENLFGGNIQSLGFSSDDKYLASSHGGQNIGVLVWDFNAVIQEIRNGENIIDFDELKKNPLKAKKLFQKIEGADLKYSESVIFDPQGKWIAASGSSKTINFFALPNLNPIEGSTLSLDVEYKGASQLAVNHQGSKLAAALRLNEGGGNEGIFSLWDVTNLSSIPEPFQIKTKKAVTSVNFSNDGEKLVFGTEGGKATVLNLENNSEIAYFDLDSAKDDLPPNIESVAFASGKENQGLSFYTANSTGTVDQWKLVDNHDPIVDPPNNSGTSISGIFLILLSLIGLALLYLSHKSLKDIICFWDEINNLIAKGKELNEPLKASANEIERSSKSIKAIASGLGEADLEEICIQKVKDDRVIEQANFSLKPVIDNLEYTSNSMNEVKRKVDSMANITKRMFAIDDNKVPTKKQVLSVINPIYLLMLIFLVSVFGFGVYKIVKSDNKSSSELLTNDSPCSVGVIYTSSIRKYS